MIEPIIQSTQGVGAANGVKILVYGRAGVGKTSLCATAPAPFILSAEAGLLSLSRYNLPFTEIKTVDDLTNLYNWFVTSPNAKQFKTICIDSITEIAQVVLKNYKQQVKDPRQAYGELSDKINEVVRLFRDLPGYHVYMTAQQKNNKDEATGISINGISMPGAKLNNDVPYFFDEFFQLDIGKTPEGETFRFLRTQPDFSNDAKDRSGKLDPIELPDLTNIINKIIT